MPTRLTSSLLRSNDRLIKSGVRPHHFGQQFRIGASRNKQLRASQVSRKVIDANYYDVQIAPFAERYCELPYSNICKRRNRVQTFKGQVGRCGHQDIRTGSHARPPSEAQSVVLSQEKKGAVVEHHCQQDHAITRSRHYIHPFRHVHSYVAAVQEFNKASRIAVDLHSTVDPRGIRSLLKIRCGHICARECRIEATQAKTPCSLISG